MEALSNIIWIDKHIDNFENSSYLNQFMSLGYKVKAFKDISEAINEIKKLHFEETFIIVSGSLYIKFILELQKIIKSLCIIPKIIIFTSNKERFLKYNKDHLNIINDKFYNLGGIRISFEEILSFILNKIVYNNNEEKDKKKEDLIFEFIDCKEKLLLPILYKILIKTTSNDEIENYIKMIYNKYSKKSQQTKKLIEPIKFMPTIPIELLSKYFIRIYSDESSCFYKDINQDLRENKKDRYLPFIKVLYEGVKLQALPLSSDKILYRGTRLLNSEINIISNYLSKKIQGLPGAIIFSKTFLSFSKDREMAELFIKQNNSQMNNYSKVLFILDKDDYIDYSLSTHSDTEEFSFFKQEKEVLFFPFSSFEVKEIKKCSFNNEDLYEIKLLYLGKYLKELIDDKLFIQINANIPNSEFKKQIIQSGLISQDNIQNANQLLKNYKIFKNSIYNPNNNNDNNDNDNDNDNEVVYNSYYGNYNGSLMKAESNIFNQKSAPFNSFNNEKILAFQKIKEEYISLKSNPITNIGLNILNLPNENNIFEWVFSLNGPKDTSYSGGIFYLKAYFPNDYPLTAPEVCFITPIYHVNINRIFPSNEDCQKLGHISISTLNWWKPEYNMTKILTDIYFLFYLPNPESPYGIDVADECINNKQLYEKKIKYFTEKYASNQIGYKEYNSNWDFSYPY